MPDQGEYAADMMFRGRQRLIDIYPEMTEHALISFNASYVMTFLEKKLTGNFQDEIFMNTKRDRKEYALNTM
ncbi:MAG: hypothetical protein HRU72_12125 [Planctomycetia bacterium]|uniref:Uncharacterized protein n=1 Tax=Candidatus Brocadia sapporoensis TaxID=392547 RepID=A0A1V6LXG4_9BACT|nr:hypothetical protein [Candidatus Brocadia sapporoensis]MDG6005963.1 hypothetical protein [Candidatus Brocadia sp.]QOJ07228.1 MAG: hypothetical protein HRU72_12125 [Planctomycetia bacterium]TVL95999.1 MAG: hypothetical protein CV082_08670 [Candidatus Brocadia sp. BL1]OQD44841.1 hypothetical protein BIY37_11470 [Candidatus Brocadia sapporoensis]GJQ23006.1 MAG: hypothetical protein HBSAPP01_07960 [Candidatus Brocadia sapporoensis]